MAKGVNKVFLLGRLGRDPEMRATAGGMTIANFTVATSDRVKSQDGQWTDQTEWHNLVAFQRTAEIVRDYCKKGKEVFIEGKLKTSSWEDKETKQKRYKTEIIVLELSLIGGPSAQSDSEGAAGYGSESRSSGYAKSNTATYGQRQPASAPDYGDAGITDDDIPF